MRGWAAELGGEGFRNPGGAGPRVQMSSQREGQWGRPGRDATAAPAPSGPGLEVALGPGGVVRGPTPGATGGARVRAERRAE